jgi:hypothetical protein
MEITFWKYSKLDREYKFDINEIVTDFIKSKYHTEEWLNLPFKRRFNLFLMNKNYGSYDPFTNKQWDEIYGIYSSISQIEDDEYFNVVTDYENLLTLVDKLFQSMDKNTTSLWTDDLECTMECVVLEDSDGVKVDENDNPTFETNGRVIVHLMDKIKKEHLIK